MIAFHQQKMMLMIFINITGFETRCFRCLVHNCQSQPDTIFCQSGLSKTPEQAASVQRNRIAGITDFNDALVYDDLKNITVSTKLYETVYIKMNPLLNNISANKGFIFI